ncbi:hypothetical protein NBRC116592_04240 [Colwellia sp. KU-HH00111]|uniref:hypothetical protein n=1 Tax=Colwellia sp. KU-HH00111 TaxID=3127652 RepID=UPI00310808AE
MKNNLFKITSFLAALFITVNANATLLFHGSSTLSTVVTQSPAEARAAWEAELFSFGIDNLDGINASGTFTSPFGNTYSETGNGSFITTNGSNIRGNRSSASLIQFDVNFQSPVNAVGFDVRDNDGGGMRLELTDSDTGAVTIFDFDSVAGSNHTEFFGVVFEPTVFISALRIGGTDPGGITYWDNFTTGVGKNAVGVDETSSFLLFGLALAVFGSMRSRKK